MSRYEIGKGIMIDEIEGMLEGINEISAVKISDIAVIMRFIKEEKNTKFYIDDKLTCRMQDERCCVYLWLDTGLRNVYGNPIFISLLKNGNEYAGHYYGTADVLAREIMKYFYKNAGTIKKNLSAFKNKYKIKCEQRIHMHIEDENEYLIQICNGDIVAGIMANIIQNLDIEYTEVEEPVYIEEIEAEKKQNQIDIENEWEQNITVGLLLDELEARQAYEEELLAKIEELTNKYKEQDDSIEALKQKNIEYKQAMVEMRIYLGEDEAERKQRMEVAQETEKMGHNLLGKKKILVLGATELNENIMKGIAKHYGFENSDFEFETDYSKVVNYSGRLQNANRYHTVLFGACPHKVVGLGDYSSLIEKFKQCEDYPYAIDARSKSGELKVTKESYRKALNRICEKLMID